MLSACRHTFFVKKKTKKNNRKNKPSKSGTISINYLFTVLFLSLQFEMRVRGMMNDNSQQRVPVTVLFIPERKKGGRTG